MQSHTGEAGGRVPHDRRRPLVALAVLFLILALGGCGSSTRPTPLVLGPEATETLEPGVGATFAPASLKPDGPPIATVNGVGITHQEWVERVVLIRFRFERERDRLQRALDAGTLDETAAQQRLMQLGARASDAESVAVDDLVELALQAGLARTEGVSITPADVDAAQAVEMTDDPNFLTDLVKTMSQVAYRRNLEGETLAAKLKETIVRRASTETGDQFHLSEIFLQSASGPDASADPGAIRTSQIVYSPNDDFDNAIDLPTDDPAWAKARSEAQATADSLRAITDLKQRADQFAATAKSTSDDHDIGPQDGDLGWVTPDAAEEAEAAALFDQPHQPGDVIGPIQNSFGWVVDLYVERRPPLSERVAKVQQRLAAPGADFATIAREESDGTEASQGGDIGWLAPFEAEEQLRSALTTATVGQVIGPITLEDGGVHFFRVEGREMRTLSPDQRDQLDSVYEPWLQERYDAAVTSGKIVFAETSP